MAHPNIEAIYRLSALQEGMLFHVIDSPGSAVYFEQYSCAYRGEVKPDVLYQAWETVMQRHAVLRTLFTWERRDQPLQIVRKQLDLPWQLLDWSNQRGETQQQQWTSLLRLDRDRGFDLERPPLFRLTLVRFSDERWRLLWSFHHLLLDGWSMRLLLDEVAQVYRAALIGQTGALPAVPQYADFIAWLDRQQGSSSEAFWSAYLGNFASPTLPGGSKPEETSGQAGGLPSAMVRAYLDRKLADRLRAFARDERVTLNTLLAGAWALVLSTHCRRRDVVFGLTVAGRPLELENVDRIAGLFINTLPLRVSLDGEASTGDWLRALQTQQNRLREFEQTPLVDIQRYSGVPAGTPLFESILVFENFPPRNAAAEQTLIASDEDYIEYSHFPLAILVVPGEPFELIAVHDCKRFVEVAVARLLAHLQAALRSIVSAGSLGELSLVSDSERHRLLETWNDTQAADDQDRTIHGLIEDAAKASAAAPALVFENEVVSYAEMDARANQLAHHLIAAGLMPGTGIGVFCHRSAEAVIVILGILKAGGAYVPLDAAFPAERVSLVIEDLQQASQETDGTPSPTLLITQQALLDRLPEGDYRLLCVDRDWSEIAKHSKRSPALDIAPSKPAYVIYTSGTTGRPKGVVVSHRSLVNSTMARDDVYPQAFRSFLLMSSLATDSSIAGVFWSLTRGAQLVLPRARLEQDMTALLALLQSQQVSHLLCLPSLYNLILEHAEPRQCASLGVVIVAGEACSQGVVERHRKRLPDVALYNEYGPSETCVWATVARLDNALAGSAPSIGRPIRNATVYLLDDRQHPVPAGVAGELFIGGAGVAEGYLNQPALTADRFIANPFDQGSDPRLYRTGDLARYADDGSIEFLGRVDNQVKVRGYRVELEEIEQVLAAHPQLAEVALLLQASGERQQLLACVVPVVDQAPDNAALLEFLKARLPDYMVPQRIEVITSLPRTPAGKLDRDALTASVLLPGKSRTPAAVPAGNEAEVILRQIWCDVLGIDDLGVHDDFFQLGGDSLLSIRILSRARQQGLQITPEHFFAHPTVAGQAAAAESSGGQSTAPRRASGKQVLMPIQHWFFERITVDPAHWNQSMLLSLNEPIDDLVIERAVQRILDHHDALRTRFVHTEEGWQATVVGLDALPPLSSIDLDTLDATELETTISDLATEMHTGLDLQHGPLMKFALIKTSVESPDRLLIVAHHLIIDAVSWQILLEDMETLCRQIQGGEALSLPAKTSSLQDWAAGLAKLAASERMSAQLSWWLDRAPERLFSLPLDFPPTEVDRFDCAASLVRSLDTEATRALLNDVPSAYNTQIMDALLAGVVRVIADWSNHEVVQLDVEGHGRHPLLADCDVSRTVGWLTCSYPLWLTAGDESDPGVLIREVKESLRGVPDSGIGYGLMRYLRPDVCSRIAKTLPASQMIFNYLGQSAPSSGLLSVDQMNPGTARSTDGPRAYLLEINAEVSDGRLQVDWSYNRQCHRRETIERLAEGLFEALRKLIAHCKAPEAGASTPSDFPLADLDQDELDKLSQMLGQMDED